MAWINQTIYEILAKKALIDQGNKMKWARITQTMCEDRDSEIDIEFRPGMQDTFFLPVEPSQNDTQS